VPSTETVKTVGPINLSHYRPTPQSRRFSISTFAVTGQVSWEAKAGGAFGARVDVLKGAFAKMIPFTSLEAAVHIESEGTPEKIYRLKAEGAKPGFKIGSGGQEQTWNDVSVLSPIEIPWVAEYALQRWSVGGEQEISFAFEDGQRRRETVLCFLEGSDAGAGDAMAILRVMKPDESPRSIAGDVKNPRPGDVLVTFRESKIAGFTVFVPLIGKLQFVAH